jgi:ABC-type transport system substrate-binding protein
LRTLPFSRRFILVSAATVFAALFLCGCPSGNSGSGGGTTSGGTTGGSSATTGGSSHPGILKYPLTAEPTTLDPALVRDGVTIDLLHNVYEGLVGWDEKSEVVPLVAKEMPKISADGKTYTFMIRDGAKFHNGRQITAEDVKYSLTRSISGWPPPSR